MAREKRKLLSETAEFDYNMYVLHTIDKLIKPNQ